MVPCDYFCTEPETYPRSLTFFGGVKSLEDLGQNVCRNSGTRVAEGEANTFSARLLLCAFGAAHAELAALRSHCIQPVRKQVAEDLPDLSRVSTDPLGTPHPRQQLNSAEQELGTEHGQHSVQQLIRSSLYWLFRIAMEGENLLRNLTDTYQLYRGLLHVGMCFTFRRDLSGRQVDQIGKRLKRIIDFVRDDVARRPVVASRSLNFKPSCNFLCSVMSVIRKTEPLWLSGSPCKLSKRARNQRGSEKTSRGC